MEHKQPDGSIVEINHLKISFRANTRDIPLTKQDVNEGVILRGFAGIGAQEISIVDLPDEYDNLAKDIEALVLKAYFQKE